jgi:hypothetical protein
LGVRILIEVKHDNNLIATSAFVNSGYEAYKPEIHIPLKLAKRLGFKLEELKGEKYKVVGAEITAYELGKVSVKVSVSNKAISWVEANAVTAPGEYEVIISDALAEQLGIEIVKPKTGLWRFHGESINRESIEPQYWIE